VKATLERSSLPDLAHLRRLLTDETERICEDAELVDADAQGPSGIDLVLADADGRPVLVDIVGDEVFAIPSRIFDHLRWLEENRRLFLRAYARDGVVKAEAPILAFVARDYPTSVLMAVGAVKGVSVRLLRAEYFLVDGAGRLAVEEVEARPCAAIAPTIARRAMEIVSSVAPAFDDLIESGTVRALFSLFRSGVDGLDGRIRTRAANGGIVFELGGRTLAAVNASPGSFTVATGDPVVNPIVVSDRVSLERALNAVVSLFVREEDPLSGGVVGPGAAADLEEDERVELATIWEGKAARTPEI
jgi:hypothetical protein